MKNHPGTIGVLTLCMLGVFLVMSNGSAGPLGNLQSQQPMPVFVEGTYFSEMSLRSSNVSGLLSAFSLRHKGLHDLETQTYTTQLSAPIGLSATGCSGVTVYWDTHFSGKSMTLGTGGHDIYRMGWNDQISAMKIPEGCWVWACRDVYCQNEAFGGSSDFIEDVPWMGQFNDWVSYMHVWSYSPKEDARVMLYKDCNQHATYGWFAQPGEYFMEHLQRNHIGNDALSALKVLDRAVLSMWSDDSFNGNRYDKPGPATQKCFGGNPPNDVISSIKIYDVSRKNHGGFDQALLHWHKRASGSANQELQFSWTMGYSTTDAQAATSSATFSTEMSDAIEASAEFMGAGVKNTLTIKVGLQISQSMTSSFSTSQHESITCPASCKPDTCETGEVFLWSFQATFRRKWAGFPGAGVTVDNSCDFICNCQNVAPACPPGFCANNECSVCTSGPESSRLVNLFM